MSSYIYIPVLKSKATTFRALRALKSDTKVHVRPLLEIVPDTEDDLLKNIRNNWDKSLPLYLDFMFLDGNGSETKAMITSVVAACVRDGFNVIPVWGPDRSPDYSAAIHELVDSGASDLAIRFPENVFDPQRADEIAKRSLAEFSLPISRLHIFLDLEDMSSGQSKFYAANTLLRLIYRKGCSTFCCIGGAFPSSDDLQEYKNTVSYLPRYDFELWKQLRLADGTFSPGLSYGDYTIRDIELPFAGFASSIIPTLRYTTEDSFYIHRGVSHKKHPHGMHQFNDECKELMEQSFYRGPKFSDGDRLISEKGTTLDSSPGNQATWAQIGVNQHIEYVVQQIASLAGA
jgi:hypothetical protein